MGSGIGRRGGEFVVFLFFYFLFLGGGGMFSRLKLVI